MKRNTTSLTFQSVSLSSHLKISETKTILPLEGPIEETMTESQSRTSSTIKLLAAGTLLCVLILSIFFIDGHALRDNIASIITWMQSLGTIAPFIYYVLHTTAVILCFPGTWFLEIGAGIVFGFWGVPLVMLSKTSGACISFLLGRTLLHDWIWNKLKDNERFQNIYHNVGRDSWKVAFLLRISPVPSWINNYGLSLTSIQFLPYMVATAVGALPMIIQNIYMGTVVSSVASLDGQGSGGWVKNVSMVVGLIATALISRMLMKYAQNNQPAKDQ
ncbi:hypothetical protein PROFUN_11960 [Planoprotostelium fungivorum]|uniref:VTT domain-containing protein n=1 Tax=Planoprotostelium fungivorum TaxID=1890364 RepID=A0A2P6N8Y5_9EUKA|nr:hypothetical protein PROFUN_11960 [Planoprotostelium fungivorum]